MAVWFVGYTPNLATAAMIAGANQLGHWITLNGQTVGGTYIPTRARLHHRRADVGRRDAGHPALAAGRDVHPAERQDINGVLTTVPDVGGLPYDQAAAAAPAGRLHRRRRRLPSTPATPPDTVAYTSPGRRLTDRQRHARSRSTSPTARRTSPPQPPHAATATAATTAAPGNGNGQRARRPRARRGPEPDGSAELAPDLRGDRTAVGAALDLRLDRAHHLAHGPHALARRAGLLRSRR